MCPMKSRRSSAIGAAVIPNNNLATMIQFTIDWFDRQIEQAHAEILAKFEAERQAEIAHREAEQRRFDAAEAEFKRLVQLRNAKRL